MATGQLAPGGQATVLAPVVQLVPVPGPAAVNWKVKFCGTATCRRSWMYAVLTTDVLGGMSIRARGMAEIPAGGTTAEDDTPEITRGNTIWPEAGPPHGEPAQVGSSARATIMSERAAPAVAAIDRPVSFPTFQPK